MEDNCVSFLMKIAERYGINLLFEHFMDFRKEDYNQFMVDGKIMDYQSYLEVDVMWTPVVIAVPK